MRRRSVARHSACVFRAELQRRLRRQPPQRHRHRIGRRQRRAAVFADRGDNVMPTNISDVSGLVSRGRLPIDLVLLQVSGPDETGRHNAGLGIEHLHATIGRARLVIAQVNPELPWTHGDTAIEPGLIDVLVPAAVPLMNCWRPARGRSTALSPTTSPG